MRDVTQPRTTARNEAEAKPQLWLIEPNAAPEDPRWQGREIWQLVVAAPSAAFARLEAEHWALGQRRLVHVGNESLSVNAGFNDEQLYFVRALPENVGPSLDEFAGSSVMMLAGPMQSTALS
jgi:hypothetical protein